MKNFLTFLFDSLTHFLSFLFFSFTFEHVLYINHILFLTGFSKIKDYLFLITSSLFLSMLFKNLNLFEQALRLFCKYYFLIQKFDWFFPCSLYSLNLIISLLIFILIFFDFPTLEICTQNFLFITSIRRFVIFLM